MISGIHNVLDSALLQRVRFDNIANNLANISTNAFKKDVVSFNETLSMQYNSETDFSQGSVIYTGNKLDVALGSKGFFKIQVPGGIRYARNGSFSLDAEGFLVTQNGFKVLGRNGPIRIDGNCVSIGTDGQISVDNAPVDKMLVVDSNRSQFFKKESSSYYSYQGGDEELFATENVDIRQGYLEKSNVDPTTEMIKMIETFRAYESAQKAIQCMDEMTSKMINDVGLQ